MTEEVLKPGQRPLPRFFELGPYRVDVAKRVLLCDGEPVPLPPKAFETLLRLLQENGQVVTKAELMAAVWPDTFVEENNLNQCISVLRRALGDRAEGAPRVETIPRRGYRLVGPVIEKGDDTAHREPPVASPSATPAESGRRPRPRLPMRPVILVAVVLAALATVLLRRPRSSAPPPVRSLAVLPFQNLSGDPQQDYFADGFTETLITSLARIQSLRVVSRTSAMHYKDSREVLPAIARELSVDALVEGAVLREGGRVRVTAKLVRGDSDSPLWVESYDREMRDVLSLQNEVARAIAREIQITLTPSEHAALTTARQVDPEAYELYLEGRYFWNKRTAATVSKARESFQRAIDRDPGYAAAYSGLADTWSSAGFSYDLAAVSPSEAFTRAKAAVARALAIDDTLAEAHNSLGFIRLTYDWDFPGAETEFKRAIQLDPKLANAHHWYAHDLIATGRTEAALVEGRRALELDPLNPILNTHIGWHYIMANQYDEAVAQLEKTLDLDPDYGLAQWYLGLAFEQKRMYPEAIERLRRSAEVLQGHVAVEGDLAHTYAVAHHEAEARASLDHLRELSRHRYVPAFELALIHFGLGRKDEGFAWLETAYHDRADLLVYLQIDPRLEAVRGDPRFRDLARRVGLPATP